jgi:biotin transport system substrate-specific component
MSAGTLPSTRPAVLADVVATSRARDVVLVVVYVAAIALSAQVALPLPFSPVPVTGQTFAVLLGAAALGPARAAAGTTLYLAAGVAGLPWFAASSGATVGYLVGFVVAGALVGRWARAGRDRTGAGVVGLMVVGNLVIYALGVGGLMLVTGMALASALAAGVVPFLVGDALKIAAAAALLPATWRRVDHAHEA